LLNPGTVTIKVVTLNRKTPMTKSSVSESTGFRSRSLLGFLPHSIGFLLVLLVFVAFPTSSALAVPKCKDVIFSQYTYDEYIVVSMTSETPPPFIIFYTLNGSVPVHYGSTPGSGTYVFTTAIYVPPGQERYFRALTYKEPPTVDSNVTDYLADNNNK
jgi:hypothetical protein